MVGYYVWNHKDNLRWSVLQYMKVDRLVDRQPWAEQRRQLMADKHKVQSDNQNMDRRLHRLNLVLHLNEMPNNRNIISLISIRYLQNKLSVAHIHHRLQVVHKQHLLRNPHMMDKSMPHWHRSHNHTLYSRI